MNDFKTYIKYDYFYCYMNCKLYYMKNHNFLIHQYIIVLNWNDKLTDNTHIIYNNNSKINVLYMMKKINLKLLTNDFHYDDYRQIL